MIGKLACRPTSRLPGDVFMYMLPSSRGIKNPTDRGPGDSHWLGRTRISPAQCGESVINCATTSSWCPADRWLTCRLPGCKRSRGGLLLISQRWIHGHAQFYSFSHATTCQKFENSVWFDHKKFRDPDEVNYETCV